MSSLAGAVPGEGPTPIFFLPLPTPRGRRGVNDLRGRTRRTFRPIAGALQGKIATFGILFKIIFSATGLDFSDLFSYL